VARTARLPRRQLGLPAELSSLVGRDLEIAAVRERLLGGRVVTLTGPGGCGKTRLALRVAALAAGGFEDGARLVELASLADAALVPASVAEALGVPERDAADPMAGVVRALAGREVLIVLDNCEHVLGPAGQVVVMLAGQCPGVRMLATSRERLDVPGELVFPVPPLGLPDDGSVRAVAASEAGRLFVARARAASPGFALTADSAAAVAEVCSRLDGMPLAIELAAARCPALGPVQLAARLEGHPGLLSGGAARPGRHRSLEALVSWSYDLLGEAERRLLARLSVLRGGFDLEVAERVAGGEPLATQAVAGLLASLAGKSLVQVQADPVARYWLLETVRQFAAGRLAAFGEDTAVHARLLEWALDEARSAEAALPSAERADWSGRLSAGQASIRAALSWALGGAEPEAGRELAARLARWWIATGRYSEAGQFLARAAGVPAVPAPGVQARVLLGGAWSAYGRGDNRRAAPLAAGAGDQATAAAAVAEARAELGGRRQAIIAAALRYAGGVMAWHRGELADAEHLARGATAHWHRGGDRMDACDGIELLGVLAAARERFPDAARLLAAAAAARRPLQYLAPGYTANRGAAARAASEARHALGEDRFTRAWEEGRGLTLDDAVAYAARKGGGRKRPAAGWGSLTPAEWEVVRLVGEGLRNDAIARRLFIAPGTVKVHLTHIFAKLGITTRAELAAQAAAHDLAQ
jgi:predicted ATPase/DNA-binding CsgD family transcriptional regulator